MEKQIEWIRKNNDKMARVIRRVKDTPGLVTEVAKQA
jgi:hypothetical protein